MKVAEKELTHEIVLHRTYPVSAKKVFDAWTQPAMLAKWMVPNERWAGVDAEIDLRVGGSYRITMRHSDGEEFVMVGEYTEVDVPTKLAFTFMWEKNSMADGPTDTTMLIELREVDGKTELTLTHSGFATAEGAENHKAGWTGMLDTLETVLVASASS